MAAKGRAKTKPLCSWDSIPEQEGMLFTTGNVNEVLPGVIRPLYADLAKWWDYWWTAGVADEMGIRDRVSIAQPPRFNQLGILGGRWAVGITFNMAMTAEWTVGEQSAMLQSFFEGGDAIVAAGAGDQDRAARANAIISQRWKDAERAARREDVISRNSYAASRKRRMHAVRDAEIVALVEENVRRMGKSFETHYYVTVGGGEYATRLAKTLDRLVPGHAPEWVTQLSSGLGEVESAKPGKAIWDLSRLIAKRKSLANEFATMTAEEVLVRLAAPPDADWMALAEQWRYFIAEYGWRGQRESDPATPTWDEAPGFVIGAIQADLRAPGSADPYLREAKATKEREKLQQRIYARVPKGELAALKQEVEMTQMLAREREHVKQTWARESRNFRPLLREFGRRLVERGTLDAVDDIWSLRWEEVQLAARGELEAKAAKKAVAARKAEFDYLAQHQMPDGVFSWPCELVPIGEAAETRQRDFKGLAVSPGIATGKARVILDAYDDAHIEPGEILVAPVTDAPWTPLFIPAAAVVVEMGGVLSHAATVAREFGIPAVSGFKDATRIIKTGQVVTVDGNTGTVTLVSG